MSPAPRNLGLSTTALLGAALFLSACARFQKNNIEIPLPTSSPNGEISMISFEPAARCVLPIHEHLNIQYAFNVPESPCSLFATLVPAPSNSFGFSKHGFAPGCSASPPLGRGKGIINQRLSVSYSPKRDQFGQNDRTHPKYYRFTRIDFTVYDHDAKKYRTIYTLPVDVTWICTKTTYKEYRRAVDFDGWKQVKHLYSDAALPEPPPKKARAKKTDVEKPTAEP